ncbi:hypothetical protein [Pseudomonas caspiana]|uniref:Uncharacterized protein n=1 Tax=Pseudomonas caspiana TaxID=1451454 RepID=A0A1Y3P6Z7_9PSED|nr:hypothetical protein [Pseudomonas caspiana]OUM75636.1 hypothetical protein AUC60_00550 [Pseudomonas caspiana]
MLPIGYADICVSISDLVSWVEEKHAPDADLAAALSLAGIDLDLAKLYDCYIEGTPIGAGDVHIYSSALNKSVLTMGLYRDLSDQPDLITASLRLDPDLVESLLLWLRRFFDTAECQVLFSRSAHSRQLRLLLDETRYPLLVDESGYWQN